MKKKPSKKQATQLVSLLMMRAVHKVILSTIDEKIKEIIKKKKREYRRVWIKATTISRDLKNGNKFYFRKSYWRKIRLK